MNTHHNMDQRPQRWQIIGMFLVSALIALSLLSVRSTMAQQHDVPSTEQPCPPEDSMCEPPAPGDEELGNEEPPICPPEDPSCKPLPPDDCNDNDCEWPMWQSSTISGTVTNDDGEPLKFVLVEAFMHVDSTCNQPDTPFDKEDTFIMPGKNSADIDDQPIDEPPPPSDDQTIDEPPPPSDDQTIDEPPPPSDDIIDCKEEAWIPMGEAKTDDNGTYTLNLEPGTYRLVFFDRTETYRKEVYDDQVDLDLAQDIIVEENVAIPDINASLTASQPSITGTVTNLEGAPLPFISVAAYEKIALDNGAEEWVETRWTETKEDGTYRFNDLPDGTYRIGYFVWDRTTEYYNDQRDIANAEDIVIADGEVITNINASVELPDECKPVPPVCDEDGNCKPVEPCEPLWDNDIQPPFCYPPEDAPLDWKPPKECWHNWQDMPECKQPADDPNWVAPPHCKDTEHNMGYITGTVTTPNGEPMAYTSVEAFQQFGIDCDNVVGSDVNCRGEEWMPMGWAETNEEGLYKMGLMPGTYRIKFTDWSWTYPEEYYNDQTTLESSTVVTVTANNITPNINASFNEPRQSITGTVTDPEGGPLAMVFVEAYIQGNTYGEHTEWIPSGWTETKEDGTYSLNNLPAGTYHLRFEDMNWNYAPKFYDDQHDIEQAQDITVTDDATTTDINISLDPPQPSITGRVTNPEGKPVAFTMVSAFQAFDPQDKRMYPMNAEGTPVDNQTDDQAMKDILPEWFPIAWAETDEDGNYSLNDLPAGTYRIEFAHWEYRITYYNGQTRLEDAEEVTVLDGEVTTDINTTLIAPQPSITGTVTDINDEPLAFVSVSAFEKMTFEDGTEEGIEEWMPVAWAETREDGTYSINDLPAGTYRVEFAYWGMHAEFYDGQETIEQAQDIVVAAGETISDINANFEVENMPPPWIETYDGNVIQNPTTGEIIYNLWNGVEEDIPFTTTVTCENGGMPEQVMLNIQPSEIDMEWNDMAGMAVEPVEIPMETTNISGTYQAIIPVEHIMPGDLHVTYACSGDASNNKNDKKAGAIQLHDPSGQITDAETGEPIKGAYVELFKVEGWQPKEAANDDSPNTCHTNATKGNRAWSDLPAASPNLGTQADPETGQISPDQNPLFTDAEGKYGWEVARGCWYVEVGADGYEPVTSPIVGVPNAVTDLNLALKPLAQTLGSTNSIFLPMVMR